MKIFIVKGRNMPPTKYRIYVKRSKTNSLIDDENIWVGNTPDDGRSKITSGRTSGPNYSYVEFNSWNELVSAITSDADFDVQPHVVIFNVNNHYTPQQVATLQIYASGDINEWKLKEVEGNADWFEINGAITGSTSSSITVKQKEGYENTGETDNVAFLSFYGYDSGGGSHLATVLLVQKCTKDYVDTDFEINAFALEEGMSTGDTAVTITSEAIYGIRVYVNITCKRTYVSGERLGEVEENHVVTDYTKNGGIAYEVYQEPGSGFRSLPKCYCGGLTGNYWVNISEDCGEFVTFSGGNAFYGKDITGTYHATYDYPFMFNIRANQTTTSGYQRQTCNSSVDEFSVYYDYFEDGVRKTISRPLNIIQPYLKRDYQYPSMYFYRNNKKEYDDQILVVSYNDNSFDGGYVSGDVKFYHDANVSGIEYEFMVGSESDFSGITITSGGTPQEHGGYVGHFKFWTKPNKELEELAPKAVVRLWADSFGPAVPPDGSGIPERSFCDIGIRQQAAPDIKLMWYVPGSPSLLETYGVNIPSSGWSSPLGLQYYIISNGTATKVINPATIDYEWVEPESGTSAATVTITTGSTVVNSVKIVIEENPYDYDVDFEFNLTGINVFGEKTYAKFIAHQEAGEG